MVRREAKKAGSRQITLDELCGRLKERIKRGVFAPGQRLIEASLVEEFGVGRTPVREALRALVGEGYLEFEENRGVHVRRLSRAEVYEICRSRESLEGLAARLTAERQLDRDGKAELRQIQAELNAAQRAGDLGRYTRANEAYHKFIIAQADNRYVATFLERLSIPIFRLQFQNILESKAMLDRNEDHRRITKAILAADPDSAESAMRAHVRNGTQTLLELEDGVFA